MSRSVALALLFALASAGCGADVVERTASSSPDARRGLFTVGDRLHGIPGGGVRRLRGAPVSPLAGWMAPAAVPSPDGRVVAYNVWQRLHAEDPERSWEEQGIDPADALAVPQLRLVDLGSGADRLLADGAYSLAWRADGTLAYARGVEREHRAFRPYLTDVVVRAAGGAEQVWTEEPDRYVVVAWAGSRLLVYRLAEGEHVDTLVLDGPQRERVLVEGGTVVALSPDGKAAFVEAGAESGRPQAQVVDLATGEVRATRPLSRPVGYAGDWVGDRVVAAGPRRLFVFRVGRGTIALEDELPTELDPIEPRFTGGDRTRIVASADTPRGGVFLECERVVRRCIVERPDSAAPGVGRFGTWRRLVHNPSRPS